MTDSFPLPHIHTPTEKTYAMCISTVRQYDNVYHNKKNVASSKTESMNHETGRSTISAEQKGYQAVENYSQVFSRQVTAGRLQFFMHGNSLFGSKSI